MGETGHKLDGPVHWTPNNSNKNSVKNAPPVEIEFDLGYTNAQWFVVIHLDFDVELISCQ